MGFQAKFLESRQPSDYEMNIDALAAEGYNVIITVGPLMGDATALKAKQYPDIKFAIVDNAYADGGLANVTSLMFAEDQVGFLAGVGLAPFHDWDSKIPADLKAQIQKASDGIKDGSIKIDLPQ